ncbi:Sphingolipid delta-4 desaturase [Fasciola hepatica]|uniref:sphingolipid 4-desaturase n=1 Tax=Fasciola hepatica TaxID=6192 RepID=A0A4E0REK9_FASHE|nr:Sphingolipid delta-4 desaturase [Fasciola hepatica]
MGQACVRTDFEWSYTEEPHATRRKEILKKYPEIKQLMGPDPQLKWKVITLVLFQIATLHFVRDLSWPALLLMAYAVGGVVNHALNLAIHEISHNLAFGHSRPLMNRVFGIFANLPIGVPSSIAFKKYHILHHRYQGDDELDVDVPTYFEGRWFRTPSMKFLWLVLQPFFYSLRPLIILPLPVSTLEIINIAVQFAFNSWVVSTFGWKTMIYLIIGTALGMGVHPVAGHFISEHFVFDKTFETYSYYGILNLLTFNVGYHVEHHDFPYIAGSRLPLLRKIAPEYYETIPHHDSWVKVLYDFVTRPDIGPFSRIRRRRATTKQISQTYCVQDQKIVD